MEIIKNIRFLILVFSLLISGIINAQETDTGSHHYEGTLVSEFQEVLVWLSIFNANTDSMKAVISIPEQGVFDKDVDTVFVDQQKIWLKIMAFVSEYSGQLSTDKKNINGHWSQGGGDYELNFVALESKPKINRPQEPKEPYPYRSEEVFFDNKPANIKLAGTLTLPENSWQAPAVILVPGSGPQNRNSELLGHQPFLVLSDYLTRKGIAVLRYDERGIGESEGKLSTATTFDLSEDVMAAYEFLRNHKGIDSGNIGIIGHSEGGLIAPVVAAKLKDISFIVMLAGPGTSGEQILYQQTRLILLAEGKSENQIKKDIRFNSKIYAIAKSDAGYKEAVVLIRKIYKRKGRFMTRKMREKSHLTETFREATIRQVLTPWFRNFLVIDPADYLKNVRCPVLSVIGSKDLQVPADPNLWAVEKILSEAGNNQVVVKEFEGLNHLFQHCETGSPTEYFKLEETFSEEVMKFVTNWILNIKGK